MQNFGINVGKASKVSVGTHDSDEVGHAFNSSLFGFGVGVVARRLSEAARNVGEGRALGHGGRARGRVGGRQTALRRRRDPIFAEGGEGDAADHREERAAGKGHRGEI